jgi:Peroxiredoxin
MRSLQTIIAGIVFAVTFTSFSTGASEAPDFTLPGSNGSPVTLSKYKGKVVLLNFWATWCGGCKVEIPWFMEFAEKYKRKGLVVIGASMDDDGWKVVRPFLKEKRMRYPVVVANSEVAKLYGLDSMPMTLMIDRHGRIASSHVGLIDKSVFESEIQKLLRSE